MALYMIAEIRQYIDGRLLGYRVYDTSKSSIQNYGYEAVAVYLRDKNKIHGLKFNHKKYTVEITYDLIVNTNAMKMNAVTMYGDRLSSYKSDLLVIIGFNDKGVLAVDMYGNKAKIAWDTLNETSMYNKKICNLNDTRDMEKAGFEKMDFEFNNEEQIEAYNNKLGILGITGYKINYDGHLIASKNITEVVLPPFYHVIHDETFISTNLKRIVMHDKIFKIGERAFGLCYGLTEIDIPGSVAVLPRDCFMFCQALRRVGLNEGLEFIENSAFNYCENLTYLKLPKSICKEIDINGIFNDYRVTQITIDVPLEVQKFIKYKTNKNIVINYYKEV